MRDFFSIMAHLIVGSSFNYDYWAYMITTIFFFFLKPWNDL